MTADELYEYGRESKPARACIPRELVQSLPRLERIHGRIVVQYWYYFRNASFPWPYDKPLYYAAFDLHKNRLVEMKALTDSHKFMQSWLDLVTYHPQMREVTYLEYCAGLLERGDITEEEIIRTQAMWLDAQAKDIFGELYAASGVRPEAVQRLISPEMADSSRYILRIWSMESDKYRWRKAAGYQALDAIWKDPVFEKEKEVFFDLRDRGPMKGIRTKEEF